jgi:hypothetical protein
MDNSSLLKMSVALLGRGQRHSCPSATIGHKGEGRKYPRSRYAHREAILRLSKNPADCRFRWGYFRPVTLSLSPYPVHTTRPFRIRRSRVPCNKAMRPSLFFRVVILPEVSYRSLKEDPLRRHQNQPPDGSRPLRRR